MEDNLETEIVLVKLQQKILMAYIIVKWKKYVT